MNILVVDDEKEYRTLLSDFLKMEGWTVFLAGHGEEGLKYLRDEKIDFIISDVYMPIMDGIKFNKKVRETPGYEDVPFLFVSAFDDQYTLSVVRNPKSDGFMRKMRPSSELKAWIQYLTTPVEKRPGVPPGQDISRERPYTRSRDDLRPKKRS
ncbi:MAG: response regulator [Ignavibacteriae bacterium]|nr:response regulator [Ignavibacteriota bacterium]